MSQSSRSLPKPLQIANTGSLLIDRLLAPVNHLLASFIRGVKSDPDAPFDDFAFVRTGVMRVLSQSASGRDFLQLLHDIHGERLPRSTFFDSLHSQRRSQILGELNTQLSLRLVDQLPDLLAGFPALAKYQIFAIDGHHIAHAVHADRDENEEYVSANSLYVLNLHNGVLANLGAVQGEGVRRHEMPVFRGLVVDWLVKHADRRGISPILVVDPAFVDNAFWARMVAAGPQGALFIMRTKSNMKPIVWGDRPWDKADDINQGVLADETVSFDGRSRMRRIRYVDPESGQEYEFLTTVMDLEPGLIALLYLRRWRIEKVFDTSKNKFEETKAWATGSVAQRIQAHFVALAHNLLALLRQQLDREHGIREEKVEQKQKEALAKRRTRAAAAGRAVAKFHEKLPAVVQQTSQFVRALRNGILTSISWADSLDLFRRAMKCYL